MKLSTALLLSIGLVSTNAFAVDETAKNNSTMPDMHTTTMESKCAKEDTKCIAAEVAAAKAAAEKAVAEHNTPENSASDYTSTK